MFRLGWAKINDSVIMESDKGSSKCLNAVSKCKFVMNSTGIFLREKSSNGFWVNINKVGKDNTRPLEHNSEICFLSMNKKVFVFMSIEATYASVPQNRQVHIDGSK